MRWTIHFGSLIGGEPHEYGGCLTLQEAIFLGLSHREWRMAREMVRALILSIEQAVL